MRVFDILKMRFANDGTRTLFESTLVPELIAALRDWSKAQLDCVLIGGLGLSYHIRPRETQDIDFLFLSDAVIPKAVPGFKRIRPHAFQHDATHVEIELVTPESVNMPLVVVQQVANEAAESDGIRVATVSGLVALKLHRRSAQDRADIIALIKTGHVDLGPFTIGVKERQAYDALVEEASTDPHPA